MKAIILIVFALSFVVCDETAESGASGHDPSEEKEKNYKKFIGETSYRMPFKTRLASPLKNGQTIHAVGTVDVEPKRIDFNFHKGPAQDSDLPLHLSCRYEEGLFGEKLVYNTFKDGHWEDNEQRVSNPFKANSDFDLRVRILNGTYKVYANRVEVGTFEQKMPLDGVDHVSINGSLKELRLFHYGGQIFKLPYNAIAHLVPGKRLDIAAMPTGNRINVNLYNKNHEYVLQISIRFNEGAIVRNTMENGMWGAEERSGGMPISKGEIFDLTIINEEYSFQIFFNGQRFATYAHRKSPSDIETVEIDGDADVLSVTIHNAVGV